MKEDSRTGFFTLIKMVIFLTVIQTVRAVTINVLSNYLGSKGIVQTLASLLTVLVIGILLYIAAKIQSVQLSVWPVFTNSKDKVLYLLATLFVVFAVVSVPILTREFSPQLIMSIASASVITPIFEEILFRGYVWNKLKPCFKVELTVCMVTSVLFAVWNLGYIDILLSTSNMNSVAGIAMMLFSKAVLGLILGLITGIARLISKNCYPSILLHILLSLVIH